MTDIRLRLGGLKFSVRVAILCVRGDRVLTNSADGLPFHFLPGGALAVRRTCAPRTVTKLGQKPLRQL